jgi:Na+/melibiose symporter-like transporter
MINKLFLVSTSQEQSQRELRPPFSLFKDPELYQVACIYMPTRLFVNLTQTYVPLYLHETLNMPATSLAIIPLILYLSSFKASLFIQYLNSKLGRKISYLIGASMGISACIWIWFGKGDQYVHLFIYPVSLLLGIYHFSICLSKNLNKNINLFAVNVFKGSGGSMMLVTSLAITADYIGHSTENGAFIYGIMSFADKLSNGCAVMLIQYM